MKKITKGKTITLIAVGMLATAAAQIFSHYVALPDLARGLSMGIGIGLLLTATIFGNFKTVQ